MNLIGAGNFVKGNDSEAIKYYTAALTIRLTLGDKADISGSYNNIGVVFLNQAEYDKALGAFFDGLKIAEELKDQKKITGLLTNIGNVYAEKGEYERGLNYQFRALITVKKIGDKELEADTYGGISSLYQDMRQQSKSIQYALLACKLYEELKIPYRQALAYNNLGMSFLELGDFVRAESCIRKGISIRISANDKLGLAQSYLCLGHLYLLQKKYKLSIEACKKTLAVFEEEQALINLRDVYDCLYAAYKGTDNTREALLYHEKYLSIKDSVANETRDKKFLQKEFQYNYDKKELSLRADQDKKNLLHAEEKRQQKIIIIAISIGLIFVAVLALVIFRSLWLNKKKNKIITEQKLEVEKQRDLIEKQKHIVEEHQKEIVDSIKYAKRIQQTLLPTTKYIAKSFERLKKR